MNLKHIIASLFVACTVFTSCAVEEDEIFDQPATLRADATAKAYNDILTGAQNGWVMEYYPSSYQLYGGFVVACKFNANGTVDVTADYATDSKGSYTTNSLYQICHTDGMTLSFDTYNEVLHYLSDPSYDHGAGKGDGYEGDFDFSIISCTSEKVVLKGTKTGSVAEMYPLKTTAEEYLMQISKVQEESQSLSYITEITETTSVIYSMSDQVLSYEYEQGDEVISGDIPFVFTTTGIKFFETQEIAGKSVSELTWDGKKFVSKDGFVIEKYLNTMDVFMNNTWYMSDNLMSTGMLQYWYTAYVNFLVPNEFDITDAYLDFAQGYAFMNYEGESEGESYSGYLAYSYETSGNVIALEAYSYDSFTASLWSTPFKYFFYPAWDTFTVEIDDLQNPSYATLTTPSGDQMILTIEPMYGPFDLCKEQ
ncbi:MAG: DUF4302 domain-containing protein [Bacteroidales bacterium]|nr:DUF4302 domain-containing protein [Bacteroidales bacterium]